VINLAALVLPRLLVCTVLLFPNSHERVPAEGDVKGQVHRFYSYFSQGKYLRMWEMLSSNVKTGNNNNKDEYVRAVRHGRSLRAKIEIRSVHIVGKKAIVILVLNLRDNNNSQWFTETHRDTWIKEKGKWLFDGSSTLAEIPQRPE